MQFYLFAPPAAGDAARAVYGKKSWSKSYGLAVWRTEGGPRLESVTCPVNPGHQGGGRRIGKLRVQVCGKRIGDFVWTYRGECIMAERVARAFAAASLSGFTAAAATVEQLSTSGDLLPTGRSRFQELVVTGRGGDADPDSGVRRVFECDACGLTRYSSYTRGLLVDPANWDGCDLFTLNGYDQMYIATERVRAVIERHALTNCMLVRVEEEVWPAGVVRPEDVYADRQA